MKDSASSVGNAFMNDIMPFAATHPVMPAEGNHERCTSCPGAGDIPAGNFSEYSARMMSVATFGAGALSGTGSARYYSFNQGLTHFLVFSAEAYTYKSGATFIANQVGVCCRTQRSVFLLTPTPSSP